MTLLNEAIEAAGSISGRKINAREFIWQLPARYCRLRMPKATRSARCGCLRRSCIRS